MIISPSIKNLFISRLKASISEDLIQLKDLAHPVELRFIEKAHPKRQTEFLLGRKALRKVIQNLGGDTTLPILPDSIGKPIFPTSYKLSLAHTSLYQDGIRQEKIVAVAVGHNHVLNLGIDIESIKRKISPAIIRKILCDSEKTFQPLMILTAKEAFYKAFSTLLPNGFNFLDLSLHRKEPFFPELIFEPERINGFSLKDFQGTFIYTVINQGLIISLCINGIPTR